jgi:hypothetical protein
LVTGLRWYFWIHGMYAEALQWLRGWRELADAANPAERAALLNGVAVVLGFATRFREAARAAREAESAAREASAVWEQSFASSLLRWITALDPTLGAMKAVSSGRGARDPWSQAFALVGPAFADLLGGARRAALARFVRVRDLAETAGDRHLTMYATAQEGLLLFLEGRLLDARGALLRHADLSTQLSNPRGVAGASEGSGYVAIADGDAALGARFLGAAEIARETTGSPIFPQWVQPHREAVSRARRALGKRELEVALEAGRRLGFRETAALVQEVHTTALANAGSRPRRAPGR